MSDGEQEDEKPFAVELAKSARSKCKKCKCPIDKGVVRIAKVMANPFGDGKMKAWHHVSCIFEAFKTQRATTKKIEDPAEDISGWDELDDEGKELIEGKLAEFRGADPKAAKGKAGKAATPAKKAAVPTPKKNEPKEAAKKKNNSKNAVSDDDSSESEQEDSPVKSKKKSSSSKKADSPAKKNDSKAAKSSKRNAVSDDDSSESEKASPVKKIKTNTEKKKDKKSRDDTFAEFTKVCNKLSDHPSFLDKTAIVKKLFTKGSDGDGFKSSVTLWCRLLLPGAVKRVYNLQSKQLIKLFARILHEDEDEMLEDLEKGDVAETIKTFFERGGSVEPSKTSELTLQEVDDFLAKLSTMTTEDRQINHFKAIIKRCTAEDLKMIIRLIKHDLRINAGPKHILGAIHDDAYEAFQASRDLPAIVKRFKGSSSSSADSSSTKSSGKKEKVATLSLMTPVLPMLAEACKSVEMAMQKCPNGMLSEVKYDGERIQVHKNGNEFSYFSRSLKPVQQHKVSFLKDYIPKAFPEGDDLILDSEVLMIDTREDKPLPFGSLGIHKQNEFKDANICLFVFDIIYYNGKSLLDKTIKERRKLLEEKMTPIKHRVVLSEVEEITEPEQLAQMIAKVFKLRLEGLVMKDVDSKYEPGKRHWLKVKKDYLFKGAMADSADLVVLGAWYGTGNKGGMMSVFLMGCHDPDRDVWLTVTKVHTGHDDATLAKLQTSLEMVKIGKDVKLVPKWLKANKAMVPDFVAKDPKKQPVWEITGAEFTNQGVHTADGISIRFPRVTRIREDKDWKGATNLHELRALFKNSAESIDYSLLLGPGSEDGAAKKRSANDKDSSESKSKKLKKSEESDKKPKSDDKKKSSNREKESSSRSDKNSKTSESNGDSEGSSRAKYYHFMNENDYIEFSRAGSPLNWIDGRKPKKHLPSAARRISKLEENEKSRCLLPHVNAVLADDLTDEKRKTALRTLKTLGAKILSSSEQSQATHVIHGSDQAPASVLLENTDVPKTAKHVTMSWVELAASEGKVDDEEEHAVTLHNGV